MRTEWPKERDARAYAQGLVDGFASARHCIGFTVIDAKFRDPDDAVLMTKSEVGCSERRDCGTLGALVAPQANVRFCGFPVLNRLSAFGPILLKNSCLEV